MNGKWACIIVLAIGVVGLMAYAVSCAGEDVAVNTTTASGKIIFQENNASHGVFLLGGALVDFETNATSSNVISSIETGNGRNVFLSSWRSDRDGGFGSAKTAVFTLTVWDPAGVPHSTTQQAEGIYSGTLSVPCSPSISGEGWFSLTSTVFERRLSLQ